MKTRIQLLLVLLAGLFTQSVLAEKVVVIVNESNSQSLSQADVKGIYTDNLIEWNNGDNIKSFDLPVKNVARQLFSNKVLGASARDVAKDWANRKIMNTAKNPPKTKKERLVVLSVRKYKNAIGYVSESVAQGKSGIKVVMTLD